MAFNRTSVELGLPFSWGEEVYSRLLAIGERAEILHGPPGFELGGVLHARDIVKVTP